MLRSLLSLFGILFLALVIAACAPTATSIPPTATPLPLPSATPSATPDPPTVTPSATPVSPTATYSPSPSATKELAQFQVSQTAFVETRGAILATGTAPPTRNATATARVIQAALKACLAAPNSPQDWNLVLCDNFDVATNGWSTSSVNSEFLSGKRSISNGRYVWQLTAKQGVVSRIWPRGTNASDFFVTVQAQKREGDRNAGYGFVFRNQGENYYTFTLWDDGRFQVRKHSEGAWSTLMNGADTAIVRAGQVNQLSVEAKGDRFAFTINGQNVGTIQDNQLSQGFVGLIIQFGSGTNATIDFDQFVLLTPNSKSKPRPVIPLPAARPTNPPVVAQPTQPPSSGCPLDPGNAGIRVVNQFDGLMTFTILNHEYKLDPHTEQLVQVPGGQPFTVSVSVVGVGKTDFGPLTLQPGECELYRPNAG